ncbi:MAG: substrate-binding periplasmic protein [Chloroflexota bacterium]
MDDERIEHALKLGPVDEPAYRRGVRSQIANAAVTDPDPAAGSRTDESLVLVRPTGIDVRRRGSVGRPRGRTAALVPIAAVVALLLVAGAVTLPGFIGRPAADGDVFPRLKDAGKVSVAVPDALPQTISSGGVHIGFDVDVAHELATALDLEPDVAVIPPVAFSNNAWDVGLGPAGLAVSPPVVVSEPYAYVPAWVAVRTGSAIRSLSDLAGRPICVAAGSSAADRLGVLADAAAGSPVAVTTIEAETDDECIAALADGRADALVTSALLADELEARGLTALPGGPLFYEPRVVQIRGSAQDTNTLLAAINRAIDGLRASGRLAELSRQSFGGRDLTEANP